MRDKEYFESKIAKLEKKKVTLIMVLAIVNGLGIGMMLIAILGHLSLHPIHVIPTDGLFTAFAFFGSVIEIGGNSFAGLTIYDINSNIRRSYENLQEINRTS